SKNLTKQLVSLKKNNSEEVDNKVLECLGGIFSQNQINIILKKKKKVNWTSNEISQAFTLRYLGVRGYKFVRQNMNFPLPGLSTLRSWATKIDLRHGLLKDVLRLMKVASIDMTKRDSLCVIQFDEVKIASTYEYDKKYDEIIGPHSQLQVVMARGLFAKWKQPIYVDFDQKITKELLFKIITEVYNAGYLTVACVHDCGGANIGLWKELGISTEHTEFQHPITNSKVFMFADCPHLLKLIRNWFIDTGFILENKDIVSKYPVTQLLKMSSTEVSSIHQLSEDHLTIRGTLRQNVKMAAQLMSRKVGTALCHYLPGVNTKEKQVALSTGNFILL
ncbi:Transposable element P transposase, partial [Aphis craccivora]